ncbi:MULTISPECIES: DUF4124 domain-containing protein [Thalassomonas]|uniref:DUF4124 domain-containing protein n=1 Tax=Thalassomonas actiniarum TaxID=485447 RepID=A0AAF0C2Z2_9GAMM|nr:MULTISPECIES: DUF4124 domain-containing protein [Thalassomonas]WDD98423.1 DUF4124 domain-containing protein [Thalassomonas actiniarum]
MIKRLSVLLAVLLSFAVEATSTKIYVWRNEQGVLVFSDTPRPGAEEVKVENKNDQLTSVDTSILDIKPKAIEEKYQVSISQPENNATVRDNTGSVYVAGRIKPIFKKGLKIQLYLDNTPYQEPQDHSMFVLRNIDRGEHKIKMDLINNQGKVIASSKPIVFYMHRASK